MRMNRTLIIVFCLVSHTFCFGQNSVWGKVGEMNNWSYSYNPSELVESDNMAFDFLENGLVIHYEILKKNIQFSVFNPNGFTKNYTDVFTYPKSKGYDGDGGRFFNGILIGYSNLSLSGTYIRVNNNKVETSGFELDDPKLDFLTDNRRIQAGAMFFPYNSFIFWEEGNDVIAGYHSLELKSDGNWKYRDTKETLSYIRGNNGKLGTLHVDDNAYILDGKRLIATYSKTMYAYFQSGKWSNLIGTDADGNYYCGTVDGIRINSATGNLLNEFTIQDPFTMLKTSTLFPVRVDPFGNLYTIRFDEPTKTVELWKLDPGIIDEERRFEIAATARSDFYENLCAIAGKPIVQTAELWGIPEGTLTESNVRMRKGPNTDSEVVTKVDKGVKVRVIGRNSDKSTIGKDTAYWYKVALKDGTIGWVFGAFVNLKDPEKMRLSQ